MWDVTKQVAGVLPAYAGMIPTDSTSIQRRTLCSPRMRG